MLKNAIKMLSVLTAASVMTACGTIYTGTNETVYTADTMTPASPVTCQTVLSQAQQKLKDFSTEKHTGAVDTKALNEMLASAVSAQTNQDYVSCQVRAQQVLSYIQRDQNYEQWDKSLTP